MRFPSWIILSSLALLLRQVTADNTAARLPSAGCGTTHNFPGQTQVFTIESSGGTRSYRLHLPSNYNANDPRPLLIVYHGSGNNPANFENESRFANETLNPNMITVFPAGVNVCWLFSQSSSHYDLARTDDLDLALLREIGKARRMPLPA